MKAKTMVLCGLLLAGANAMACYTVYDGNNRVVYRGHDTPVDMSLPLHQALAQRFPAGASMVFDQAATCAPVSVAQAARPTAGTVPPNTIRMERTGRQLSPSSAAPLFTDVETAQRQNLPYTVASAGVAVVPGNAAARVDIPTFSVIPSQTAVAQAPAAPDTTVLGAGPARQGTVITELRDPPLTIIQRGGSINIVRE